MTAERPSCRDPSGAAQLQPVSLHDTWQARALHAQKYSGVEWPIDEGIHWLLSIMTTALSHVTKLIKLPTTALLVCPQGMRQAQRVNLVNELDVQIIHNHPVARLVMN